MVVFPLTFEKTFPNCPLKDMVLIANCLSCRALDDYNAFMLKIKRTRRGPPNAEYTEETAKVLDLIREDIPQIWNTFDSDAVGPDDMAHIIGVPQSNLKVIEKKNIPAAASTSTSVQTLRKNINTPLNSGSIVESLLKRKTLIATVFGPPSKKVCQDLKFGNQDEQKIPQMKKQSYVKSLEMERELGLLQEKQKLEREILQQKLKLAQVQKKAAEEEASLRMKILELEKVKVMYDLRKSENNV